MPDGSATESLPDDVQPVFLLATGRSGTTLLRLKLGVLPGVVSFPESNFWVLKERSRDLDLATPEGRSELADRMADFHQVKQWRVEMAPLRAAIGEGASSWRRAFEILVERFVAERGPAPESISHWCEKSPPHVFRRDSILEDFPEARFLYLIRDPRGVAASMKSCRWAHNNVLDAAGVWRAAARRAREDDRSIVVRYEDLATDPETQIRRIADFMGVPYDPAAVHGTTPDELAEKHQWIQQAMQPISAKNVDNWRQRLCYRDRELELIQHVCRDEMQRFGYELRPERRDARFRVQLALKWTELALSKLVPA